MSAIFDIINASNPVKWDTVRGELGDPEKVSVVVLKGTETVTEKVPMTDDEVKARAATLGMSTELSDEDIVSKGLALFNASSDEDKAKRLKDMGYDIHTGDLHSAREGQYVLVTKDLEAYLKAQGTHLGRNKAWYIGALCVTITLVAGILVGRITKRDTYIDGAEADNLVDFNQQAAGR
jgi:hypothetical protein